MRVLTGKFPTGNLQTGKRLTDKLLTLTTAFLVFSAPAALAGIEGAPPVQRPPMQVAQAAPPAIGQDQQVPEPNSGVQVMPPLAQPGTQPLPAEIPKPFHGTVQ